MIAFEFFLVALAAQAPAPLVEVPWPVAGPMALVCPSGQATRVVFPEPLRRLRTYGPDRQAIAVTVERTTPTAIVVIRPQRHPARSRIEFRGLTLTLELDVTTTAAGPPQELRLAPPGVGTVGPDATRTPADGAAATIALDSPPTRAESGAASVPVPADVGAGDPTSQQLPWAHAQPIGRREGLPGQPTLVLEDALSSEEWIWYRLRLEGGAHEQITAIEWERGPISDLQERSEGADRRIVVRLPRRFVNRHTRLVLKLASGPVYRVPPFAPTVSGFFRQLFR
jgi:hypothetical protein